MKRICVSIKNMDYSCYQKLLIGYKNVASLVNNFNFAYLDRISLVLNQELFIFNRENLSPTSLFFIFKAVSLNFYGNKKYFNHLR